MLAVPLGLLGALIAIAVRVYPHDLYTQIGIITLIGLSAKNAILIVEYAKLRRQQGASLTDAAEEAARLRFRPILMTSFAFLLGVLPLVVATGAGAASRRALGTAVFGGMATATVLGIFVVPALYVLIQRFADRRTNRRTRSGASSGHRKQRRCCDETLGHTGCAVVHGVVHAGPELSPAVSGDPIDASVTSLGRRRRPNRLRWLTRSGSICSETTR